MYQMDIDSIFEKNDSELDESKLFRKQFGREMSDTEFFAQEIVNKILGYEIISDEEVIISDSEPGFMIRAPFDDMYLENKIVSRVENILRTTHGVDDHIIYADGYIEVYLDKEYAKERLHIK